MKCMLFLCLAILALRPDLVQASAATDTTITITAQNPGPVPFINQLTLSASDISQIKAIQFTITPKTGSVTRPLSGTYSADYLSARGYLLSNGIIYVPVYGLYAGYSNTVTLTYSFVDGSSKGDSTTIATPAYDDPCQYGNPLVLQARTSSTALSYDFFMVRERCSGNSPTILDSDSNVRWVGPAGIFDITSAFYDNTFYLANGRGLSRIDLDGTITFLHDYADVDVVYLHHNIDRGKFGLILDADTSNYFESTNIEIDAAGNVLKIWNLADIISAAMTAGGDDPSQFVYPSPTDWFHNNSVVYNRADDSLIISSRENFVICLDYETSAIKWILGDPTKKWYQFPSLRQYALTLSEDSNPPIGQHSVSITYDQKLLLFDNGYRSWVEMPPGADRSYSSPRKYQLDLSAKTATEIWSYPMGETIFSGICSGIYEDAPQNYVVDYAYVYEPGSPDHNAQILGLDASGNTIFHYQYPNAIAFCDAAYNSIPLHLETTRFPAVGPQALNLSTRGYVGSGENSLIGGFIITGALQKEVVLRALGPSLTDSDPNLTGTVADPLLELYDSSGNLVATNDDWQSDPDAAEITAEHLAPAHATEAATLQLLAPGAYTFVVNDKNLTPGLGLVEAYDLSPGTDSRLANLSTRGLVGTENNALISGVIVGDVASATVCIRALGPSLTTLSTPLADPVLTIYDANGTVLGGNDDWQQDPDAANIDQLGLAPANPAEAATLLHLPAGSYTAIETGVDEGVGSGLVEFYDLD